MPPNVTRPCAFVLLRAGDRVLVSEMHDDIEGVFYRPPGGGIEFQESSDAAARRELQEELNVRVDGPALLGVREAIFTHRGEPYHEIAFLYEAWLSPEALDALDGTAIVEDDGDIEIARVVDVADLRAGRFSPLYPAGVLDLLG
jgi:ADP-ribose pyrophosphatase YjhB (NUDIX family)